MATTITTGQTVSVVIPGAKVLSVNPDNTYALIRLPDDGSGNPLEFWVPITDSRITVTPAVPANWPPVEGDVWIVPNQTPEAFVVSSGGTLYFVTGDNIRQAYSGSTPQIPITTDQALATYGTAMTLLYRKT